MKNISALFLSLLATALSVVPAQAWSLKGHVQCPGGQGYENVRIRIDGTSCQGPFTFTATTDAFGNYALSLPDCDGAYKACLDTATLPPGAILMSPRCVDFTTDSTHNEIDISWTVTSDHCNVANNACPLTQGYWKNHANRWPVTSLTLGSQTYTQVELLVILKTPVGKGTSADASLILADQLIAADLNIANGSNAVPISGTIALAQALLSTFSGKLPYQVAPSSAAGQQMVLLGSTLDQYNNGHMTPNCHN